MLQVSNRVAYRGIAFAILFMVGMWLGLPARGQLISPSTGSSPSTATNSDNSTNKSASSDTTIPKATNGVIDLGTNPTTNTAPIVNSDGTTNAVTNTPPAAVTNNVATNAVTTTTNAAINTTASATTNGVALTGDIVLPKSVPDPIEPFNRAMWALNKGLMMGIIKPTAKVYRLVVRKPVRNCVNNFSRNLTYPDRVINNLLQARWAGARDETYDFLCNTTAGVAGLFDVAAKWKIPKSDADFGQTFGEWGWKPQCFIMLPIYGPSNERDTLGLIGDTAVDPLLYIPPYDIVASDPTTWLNSYSYFTYFAMYNKLSDSVDDYVRFSQAEMDPYSEVQYAWTFARANRKPNLQREGKQDEASLETIESVFFSFKDPEFPNHSKTRSVKIASTGKKLDFTYWLQPGNAPVVYIVPGLGSHRLAQTSLALAELVYDHGYSAVCISSAFNTEFMEQASTAAMPAYLPVDGHDVHVALTEVDKHLRKLYPERLGKTALMGYSMGALHSLFVAATAETNQSLIQFDRYLALNTPVRLTRGIAQLDDYYRAPLKWPEAERTDNIENTFLKMAVLSKSTLTPQTAIPFNEIESKFLVGLTFRLALRDIIFSSQQRHNQGVLHHHLGNFRRYDAYQEILKFSFQDYYQKIVIPYYQAVGMTKTTADQLEKAGDLHAYEAGLKGNTKVHVFVNQNDFLLATDDLDWLRATFPADQLTVFAQGGHLGNLANPKVQKIIMNALSGLGAVPAKTN